MKFVPSKRVFRVVDCPKQSGRRARALLAAECGKAWGRATSPATTRNYPEATSTILVRFLPVFRSGIEPETALLVCSRDGDFSGGTSRSRGHVSPDLMDPTLTSYSCPVTSPVFPNPIAHPPFLSIPRAGASQDGDGQRGPAHLGHGQGDERLVALCPKCNCQLMIPPDAPTVACGSCGQVISPVVNRGGYGDGMGAQAPAPAAAPARGGGKMVKCPLCAALLQQPPGASLAICGGCHQVIGMPEDPGGGGQNPGDMPPDSNHQRDVTLIISCPSCSLQLQPPPGAPLVACGGCRQVMQVPGVKGVGRRE